MLGNFAFSRGCVLCLVSWAVFVAPAGGKVQDDPPGRIGRLAWASDEVQLVDPETGKNVLAPLNLPLTSGNTLLATGRAEIEIGSASLRLDDNTLVSFSLIGDEGVQVLLRSGHVILNLPAKATLDFALETSQGRFVPRKVGVYRFDKDANGVTVRPYSGLLGFKSTQGREIDIAPGESVRLWDDGSFRSMENVRDEFDQWSAARDEGTAERGASFRYVSPEMTGGRDLDEHGDWSETPDFGAVWFPRAVGSDWVPYRNGHWAWVAPWGWSWIGHESWGFAPFHYGRWVQVRGAWGWAPGARKRRPVYAPALVGWTHVPVVGFLQGRGEAPPSAGWFPLGPREAYAPSYRASPRHVGSVNAPHGAVGSTQSRRFVHREGMHAVSSAPAEAFEQRRFGERVTPHWVESGEAHGHKPPFADSPRRPLRHGVRPGRIVNAEGFGHRPPASDSPHRPGHDAARPGGEGRHAANAEGFGHRPPASDSPHRPAHGAARPGGEPPRPPRAEAGPPPGHAREGAPAGRPGHEHGRPPRGGPRP